MSIFYTSHAFKKVDIETPKVDIGVQKVDIEQIVKEKLPNISSKTRVHILKLYTAYKDIQYFGRTDVSLALGLKPAMASRLLKTLLTAGLIEPVDGKGKGKYRFVRF